MQPSAWFLLGVLGGAALVAPLVVVAHRRRIKRLRESEARARRTERLAEIGAMTRGLAHEIKNPLSTIGLNAQLLEESIDELAAVDEDERARLVRRVAALRREAERLGEILGDFLSFAGEVRLSTARIDLNGVVDELVDFFAPQAQHFRVRLRVELGDGPMLADLDANHLKQALLNLFLNATQAMAAGRDPDDRTEAGELMIRTGPGELPEGGHAWAVHVIDTGPGMDDDLLGQIFTPYFTTKGGGTGLGLPTTKRLIEEHGGAVTVYSEPGRGTEFVVLVPRDASE